VPPTLFNRRLIFVTGKGGAGKSTVALALGMAAAERGLRTIVVELARGDGLQRAFEQHGGRHFEEIRLAQRLYTISIDPQAAMEEYLMQRIPGAVAGLLAHSRLFNAFAMATPGMREMLSIGKAWELAQPRRRTEDAEPYDLVIVDSPASGHSIGLLRTPRTFAAVAKVGPIAHQGQQITDSIEDPSFTAIVAVSTAEEMPVNETLDLQRELQVDGLELDAVVLNAAYPDRFTAQETTILQTALSSCEAPTGRAAIETAISEHARARTQATQQQRLREPFGDRLITLPFLFEADIGPHELRRLAQLLGEALA